MLLSFPASKWIYESRRRTYKVLAAHLDMSAATGYPDRFKITECVGGATRSFRLEYTTRSTRRYVSVTTGAGVPTFRAVIVTSSD